MSAEGKYRGYVLDRLKTLASSSMTAYNAAGFTSFFICSPLDRLKTLTSWSITAYNAAGGGAWQRRGRQVPWHPGLPSDAKVVFHVFAAWMDELLPPCGWNGMFRCVHACRTAHKRAPTPPRVVRVPLSFGREREKK